MFAWSKGDAPPAAEELQQTYARVHELNAELQSAGAWAAKATVACGAPVEVRPFQDIVPSG